MTEGVKSFFRLYGRKLLLFALPVILLVLCGLVLEREWRKYGIADDGGRTDIDFYGGDEETGVEKIELCAQDRRVRQGDRLKVGELAQAWDGSGNDLRDRLCFRDEKGRELTGWFPTDKPGIYYLTVFVKGLPRAEESRKEFVVLVDGRLK